MLSSTWTREELLANAVSVETTVWRVVEAQYRVSTMKLADSVEEQTILEKLIEETKPPIPDSCKGLNYLLFTPFRYAAMNPRGSRFRQGGSRNGVFYASASPETAISEMAFYRLLFFSESPGTPLPTNPAEYTAFAVHVRSARCIDLTRPPFNAQQKAWGHSEDYSHCQAFANLAKSAGIQMICYPSVRDPKHRMNYAVFDPSAFAHSNPVSMQTWHMHVRQDAVVAKCEAPSVGLSFAVSDFAADSRISVKNAA